MYVIICSANNKTPSFHNYEMEEPIRTHPVTYSKSLYLQPSVVIYPVSAEEPVHDLYTPCSRVFPYLSTERRPLNL
jgi:hypothetical protein